jgi:hypothetical protein
VNPTITFGIPIAPKARIDYWDKAMLNLNRTLSSLDNQSSSSYNVVLVKTRDDELQLDKEYRNLFTLNCLTLNEFSEDKDDKTKLAMYLHQDLGGAYFFRLDWDDLVHRDLVKFIEESFADSWFPQHGWVIQNGYFYKPDIESIIPFSNYWQHCGSAFAINYSKEECINGPSHEFHHQRLLKHRADLYKPLSAIPFSAGMYVIHDNNISFEKHKSMFRKAEWRLITSDIMEEFGL